MTEQNNSRQRAVTGRVTDRGKDRQCDGAKQFETESSDRQWDRQAVGQTEASADSVTDRGGRPASKPADLAIALYANLMNLPVSAELQISMLSRTCGHPRHTATFTAHRTQHTAHSTEHTAHSTQNAARSTQHTAHSTAQYRICRHD